MEQTNSPVADCPSYYEVQESANISPRSSGWINDRCKLCEVNGKKIRVCIVDGCGKTYSAQSSHVTFKKHVMQEHPNEDLSFRKTTFLFSDQLHINRLIKMIIDLHLPYSTVEKISLKLFAASLSTNKTLVCRKTVSSTIRSKTIYLSGLVTQELAKIDCMALTFDIWSPREGARGFGCITAHFLGALGDPVNIILNFKRLKFPHTGDAICKFIQKTIESHNLEEKIVAITTDNASNNLNGIRKLSQKIELSPLGLGFLHYKCLAHIIDLGIKAALKTIKPAISCVRNAVIGIGSSTKRNESFIQIQERLIQDAVQMTDGPLMLIEDVKHRWSSCFLMLERAHILRSAIDKMLSTTPDLMQICQIDWQKIELLLKFLSPFHDATKRVCIENDCNISTVSYLTPKLILHCLEFQESSDEDIKLAAKALGDKLDNYRLEIYHPIVNIAYILDPRYKTKGLQEQDATFIRSQLRTLMDSMPNLSTDMREKSTSQRASTIFDDSDNEDETFDELEAYLSSKRESSKINAFNYWKSAGILYPKLAALSRRILCIQATSVASERAFSEAGNVDTLSRNRLADESVECNLLLKSWMRYLSME